MPTTSDLPDTGPSLFADLVAGLAALDAPAPPANVRVVVDHAGGRSVHELPADGGIVLIGRSADAGVVVDVAQASRRHAELHSSGGTVSCHDAGSSYGTWIVRDGERLDVPVELVAGDRVVTAGDVVLLDIVELQP